MEIRRKGRRLRLVPEPPDGSRLSRVRPLPGLIVGDPDDLAEVDWSGGWDADRSLQS